MEGGTTFHFVTDGIESALEQARAAAGGKDVALAGGAARRPPVPRGGPGRRDAAHLVPILLGRGERLFEGLGPEDSTSSRPGAIEAPGVTHLSYRRA